MLLGSTWYSRDNKQIRLLRALSGQVLNVSKHRGPTTCTEISPRIWQPSLWAFFSCTELQFTVLQLVFIDSCTFTCAPPGSILLCLSCSNPLGYWRQQLDFPLASLSLLAASPSASCNFSPYSISACCFKGLTVLFLVPGKQKGVSKAVLLWNHGHKPGNFSEETLE